VAADDCALIGRLRFNAPEQPGDLLFGLALNGRTGSGEPVAATRRAGVRIV
jgi:hypothetical protein